MPAPALIHKLVETFEQNLDEYRSSKNETELRREFLDRFFTALGWDVANEKGYDEAHKEVVHEFSVDVAGQGKKADYAFRTGGDKFDFLVEAKKPSVNIETNVEAAFQLRRYGWSAKLPLNILTDFEHLAVYEWLAARSASAASPPTSDPAPKKPKGQRACDGPAGEYYETSNNNYSVGYPDVHSPESRRAGHRFA